MQRRARPRGRRAVANVIWSALAAGLGAACAHDEGLVPAPHATLAPGSKSVAYDQANGVSVFVDGDAWKGEPRDLEEVMAPVWVTVQNRGQHPVRLLYRDFSLQSPAGLRANPLPPLSIQTTGPERARAVRRPSFRHDRFYLSPFYRPFYPGMRTWSRAFPYDSTFYDTYYARWRVPLPTEDMLRAALPEGVLEPGGQVAGFLYFPYVARETKGTLVFEANLTQDPEGTSMAQVGIPLQTK